MNEGWSRLATAQLYLRAPPMAMDIHFFQENSPVPLRKSPPTSADGYAMISLGNGAGFRI